MRGWETGPDPKPIQKEDIDDDMLVSIQFDDIPEEDQPELRQIAEVTEDSRLVRALDGSGITVETFRRCAMFRNVEIAPETDLV